MKTTNPIPQGYTTITPYLIIKGASKAVDFYKKAFGAIEHGRLTMPDGKLGHCELQIGNSRIMIADEFQEWQQTSPDSLGGSPVGLYMYVPNVDEVFKKAIEAGAKTDSNMTIKDQFYGDRSGTLIDPFGHKWTIATSIEEFSFEEMQKRYEAMYSHMNS